MSDEDRRSPPRAAGTPIARGDRATARRTGCAWSRTSRPPTTRSTTSSPTRCSGSRSTTSGGSAPSRISTALERAWDEGYEVVNRAFADAVIAELDSEPDAAVFFHDYHLYLAPAARAGGPARTRCSRTSSTSRGRRATTGTCCRSGCASRSTTGCWRTTWSASTPRAGGGTSRRRAVALAGRGSARRGTSSRTAAGTFGSPATRSRSTSPSSTQLAGSEAVLARERALQAERPELLVAAGRSHRPVEEHRARLSRVRPAARAPSASCTAASGCSRCSTRRGRTSRSYAEYLAAIEREAAAVNERFGRAGWQPVDLRVADDFPQSVAAYKQFDVLLVNAVFDGLNLVAKEGPLVNERDGVLVLSENAGAHEELGEWALTRQPVRRLRPGGRDLRGARDAGRRARAPGGRDPRAGARERAWTSGPRQQLADLDAVRRLRAG